MEPSASSQPGITELLENIGDGFTALDRNGRVTYMNAFALKRVGMREQDVLGRDFWKLFPAYLGSPLEAAVRSALDSGRAVSYEIIGAISGRWHETRVYPSREGVSIFFRDIQEQKTAREAVRAGEERLRALAEAMPHIVWTCSPTGRVTFVNPQWTELTGLSIEQTTNPEGVSDVFHPDDAPGVYRQWRECLATGTPHEAQWRFRRRSDGAWRWFLTRAVPVRDGAGRITEWVGTATDIHDQKTIEEQLAAADRHKDEFLATLAHELRNPLAPLTNGVEILRRAAGDAAVAGPILAMMDRQLRHMARLVDDLLDLSRISHGRIELHRERVDLASVLRQALEATRPAIEAALHQLTVELPPEALYVHADGQRLAQAFANLLSNAAKYTPAGGRIGIVASASSGECLVRISDNGIGIPRDMLPRVFEMFTQVDASLDQARSGLGIGLSIVKRLIEMHGGTVEGSSAGPGEGSEFAVRLPLCDPAGEGAGGCAEALPAPRLGRPA